MNLLDIGLLVKKVLSRLSSHYYQPESSRSIAPPDSIHFRLHFQYRSSLSISSCRLPVIREPYGITTPFGIIIIDKCINHQLSFSIFSYLFNPDKFWRSMPFTEDSRGLFSFTMFRYYGRETELWSCFFS